MFPDKGIGAGALAIDEQRDRLNLLPFPAGDPGSQRLGLLCTLPGLGDLGAHIIDMARFVTGDEIVEVSGAISETFIKERTIPTGTAGAGIASGAKGGSGKKGKVLVDDAVLFLARFKGGAVGSFASLAMRLSSIVTIGSRSACAFS